MIRLLTNNPYRILGVYSNSPKKDVLSNLNKSKAFIKVGKSVSFPLDLPTLLPALARDQASFDAAQAAIELPMDRIKHSMFWFIKATPFDDIAFNHIFSGNISQAKAIWNKKESVTSLLNLMVCAMIANDYSELAVNADKLFMGHADEYCKLIDETIKITSSQLNEIFVDAVKADGAFDVALLAKVTGTSAIWQKTLGGSLVQPLVDQISAAIAEAKTAKGPLANYNAGITLMNSTKTALANLGGLLGMSEMQYQMIADKLSQAILQCSINYFNETDDDNAPQKGLVLMRYAKSIAVGHMAKGRCDDNIHTLENIGPEFYIQREMDILGKFLKNFKNKNETPSLDEFSKLHWTSKTVSNYKPEDVKTFVTNCKPYFSTIRSKIGATNELYIRISSTIAGAAISAIIDIVNKAQEHASMTRNTGDLVWTLMTVRSIMAEIGQLDMDASCRNYYSNNNGAINRLYDNVTPKPQNNSSNGCYIATMVYGDYDHPQVMVLRNFRDTYLAKRDWGKDFIKFYYKHSPAWVEKLKSHKAINSAIKAVLDVFIKFWKKHISNE